MNRFIPLVIIFYATVSGLVLFFTVTNWPVYGESLRTILLYIGLPAFGLLVNLFLLAGSWFRIRETYVLITLPALAAAYAFEFWVVFSQERFSENLVNLLEVAEQLSTDEQKIYLPIGHPKDQLILNNGHKVVPLGGVPKVRTITFVDNDLGYEIFISDRNGFRNPDDVWDLDQLALAFVGDSYTFGNSTTTEESFVGILRKENPAALNLGVGGNGPLSELATIIEYLPKFRPPLVFWFYYPNDLEQDIIGELNHPILPKYLEPAYSQSLSNFGESLTEARQIEYSDRLIQKRESEARSQNRDSLWSRLLFRDGINPLNEISFLSLRRARSVLGLVEGGGDWPEPNETELELILEKAKETVEGWGGTIVFVYLPSWNELINHDRSKVRYTKAAKSAASNAEIEIIDLTNAFSSHPDPKSLFPWRKPGHYGAEGHRLVADRILEWLKIRKTL